MKLFCKILGHAWRFGFSPTRDRVMGICLRCPNTRTNPIA